jgi:hypothetical protein
VPVGHDQQLSADQESDTIDMTVTAVQPLAPDQFNTPDPGKHYVGVFLKYQNLGTTTYNDAPGNEVMLILDDDTTVNSDIANVGGCSNNGNLTVGAGETIRSCVTSQVPDNRTIKSVEVALDSGHDPPGEWRLGAAASSAATTASTPTSGGSAGLPNHCSPGLTATQSVSCSLASNVFYEYFRNNGGNGALSAWSAVSKRYYSVSCSPGAGFVNCAIGGTGDPNAEVSFTEAALSAYSPQQARAYAAKHDVGPNG